MTDPKNPRGLGVTRCASCGQPPEIVGALGQVPDQEEMCTYCAHDFRKHDALRDEAARLLRPWIEARSTYEGGDVPLEDFGELVTQAVVDITNELQTKPEGN